MEISSTWGKFWNLAKKAFFKTSPPSLYCPTSPSFECPLSLSLCYFAIWYYECNGIMDLNMWSLGALVLEGPCNLFYATRCQVYCGLTHGMFSASALIWYLTHKQKKKTLWANKHNHKYILTLPFMHSEQLLHWLNNSLI